MGSDGLKNNWIIIGVSGVTCGGKTTLANMLANKLAPSCLLNQDTYFYPDDSPRHVKVPNLDHNNYDILSSLNMERMHNDILDILKTPIASDLNIEKENKFRIRNKCFLILDGFTILNYKPIADLCDLKYYITLDMEECFVRRTHRLYDPPDVEGYFELCVWPEHVKYRREIEHMESVTTLDGRSPSVFDNVMADLKNFKPRRVHETCNC